MQSRTVSSHMQLTIPGLTQRGGYGLARRRPPRKVTYLEPVPRASRPPPSSYRRSASAAASAARRASNVASSTPGAVIHRPVPGVWHPRMPERLDEEELAEWRAGRDAGLSARRADNRRSPRGCRRIRPIDKQPRTVGSRPDRLQGFRSMRSIVSIGTWQTSATWETVIPYFTRVRRRADFFAWDLGLPSQAPRSPTH
jgi:hypothetical protein